MSYVNRMKNRISKALGEDKVQLVLKNVNIVNVFSGNIQNSCIAIDNGKIIGIGEYEGYEEIDLDGQYACPGLIDSHIHLESTMVTPNRLQEALSIRGTTTLICDPHEIANVKGIDGIEFMLEITQALPMNFFFMIPSCVPATKFETSGSEINSSHVKQLISDPRILGLGEMMNYVGVINREDEVLKKFDICKEWIIDGHGPMLEEKNLNAYMINGVKTDHECSTINEMNSRIDRGMYVAIREGSAAKNLDELIKGVSIHNKSRVMFCSDDKHPNDIISLGHIDFNVRRAISLGIDPVIAIQMATINPATCYNLRDIGAIAPGYDADIVIFDNLKDFNIKHVYKSGNLVSTNGNNLINIESIKTQKNMKSMNVKKIKIEDLKLKLDCDVVNVIGIEPKSLLTTLKIRKINLNDGYFSYDNRIDIAKIVVVERHKNTGNIGIGLVENFKIKEGAFATTIAHDSHNIIVVGKDDLSIKTCIDELIKIDGGLVVANKNTVIQSIQLEIGGLMSDTPILNMTDKFNKILKTLHEDLGIRNDMDPFMMLSFLALPVIPDLKMTDKGLFDVKNFKHLKVDQLEEKQ